MFQSLLKIAIVLSLNNAVAQRSPLSLQNFFEEDLFLDFAVDLQFNQMSDTLRVAQLLMPAAGRLGESDAKIEKYLSHNLIGGVLLLNGTVDGFTKMVQKFDSITKANGGLPMLYSADAEPSLIQRKIQGATAYKKANEIKTIEEVRKSAEIISDDLKKIGITYNFAPVVDMPPNATVGYRSIGIHEDSIVPWSREFIRVTQEKEIIATAKHFPGHGYVVGDTHKNLVYIDGEMREVKNYTTLIEDGVLSIMIAHIAIRNNEQYNTNNKPSTISRNIVTGLLRDNLGFQGLIVTDAMNMGGISKEPNAALKAVQAGCDIVLMPLNVEQAHQEILALYQSDETFRAQVDASVKRIIRMKFCLNLLQITDLLPAMEEKIMKIERK